MLLNEYICSPLDAYEQSKDKLKILIVASSPIDENVFTSYQKEIQEIYQELAFQYVSAALIQLNPPTCEKLFSVLHSCNFDVIHFICHSNKNGIQLENRDGTASWLSIQDLYNFMCEFQVETNLILMNTCESFNIGYELENIPNFIAIASEISNDVAIKASRAIYSYLAANTPIENIVKIVNQTVDGLNNKSNMIIALGRGKGKCIFPSKPARGEPIYFKCEPINNIPIPRYRLYDKVKEMTDIYNAIENETNPFIGILALVGKGKTTLSILCAMKYSWKFQKGIAYASFEGKDTFDLVNYFSHFDWKLDEYSANTQIEIALYELSQGPYLLIFDDVDSLPEFQQEKIVNFLKRWDVSLGGCAIFTVKEHNNIISNLIGDDWIKIQKFSDLVSVDMFTESIGGQYKIELLNLSPKDIVKRCHYNPKLINLTASALKVGVSWEHLKEQLEHFDGTTYKRIVTVLESTISHIEDAEPNARFLIDSYPCFQNNVSMECWYFVAYDIDEKSHGDYELAKTALLNADIIDAVNENNQVYFKLDPTVSKYIREKRWSSLPKQQIAKYIKRHIEYNISEIKEHGMEYINSEWENILYSIKNADNLNLYDEVLAISEPLIRNKGSYLFVNNMWYYSNQILGYAITAAKELKDHEQCSNYLYICGLVLYRLTEYPDAIEKFNQSKKICESNHFDELLYENEIQIGRICYRLEDYPKAKEIFLKLLDKNSSLAIQSKVNHELGRLAFRDGDSQKALDYLEEALKCRKQLEDFASQAQTLHEIARTYQQMNDTKNAQKYYNKSYEIKKGLKDKLGLEATLHQIGLLYYEQGDYKKAKEMYEECINISIELKDRFWIIHNNFRYGSLLWELDNNRDEAKEKIMEALGLSNLLGIRIKKEIVAWIENKKLDWI